MFPQIKVVSALHLRGGGHASRSCRYTEFPLSRPLPGWPRSIKPRAFTAFTSGHSSRRGQETQRERNEAERPERRKKGRRWKEVMLQTEKSDCERSAFIKDAQTQRRKQRIQAGLQRKGGKVRRAWRCRCGRITDFTLKHQHWCRSQQPQKAFKSSSLNCAAAFESLTNQVYM